MFDPITPERATSENLLEVAYAYVEYLGEHARFDGSDTTREHKVTSSLRYCEQVMTYYLSFLPIARPITDSTVSMVCEMISEAREGYTDTYAVPDILKGARSLAQDARRAPRRPNTPPAARKPLPGTPVSGHATPPAQLDLFDAGVQSRIEASAARHAARVAAGDTNDDE